MWTPANHIMSKCKRDGGGVMIWACLYLTVPESAISSDLYQRIVESNVSPSIQQLNLDPHRVMQQGQPKHSSKLQQNH